MQLPLTSFRVENTTPWPLLCERQGFAASHRCWQDLAVSLPRSRILFICLLRWAAAVLKAPISLLLLPVTSIIQRGVQDLHPRVPGTSVAGCQSTLHAFPFPGSPISHRNCPENTCADTPYYPGGSREMCPAPVCNRDNAAASQHYGHLSLVW